MFKRVKNRTKQTVKYIGLGVTCCTVVFVSWAVMTYKLGKEVPKNYRRPVDF